MRRQIEMATACLRVLLPGYMVDARCHEESPFFDAFCLLAASLLRATEPASSRRTPTPVHPALTRELAAPAEAGETAAERAPEASAREEPAPEALAPAERAPEALAPAASAPAALAPAERAPAASAPEALAPEERAPEDAVAEALAGAEDPPGLRDRWAMRVRNVMPSRCRRPKQEEPATWRQMPLLRMGRWCSVSARSTAGNVHSVTSARAVALDRWGNANVTSAASQRQIAARRTGCAGAPMPAPPHASVFRAAFAFAAKEIPYIGRKSRAVVRSNDGRLKYPVASCAPS